MRLVDGPLHTPGVCVCCKGGTNRQCVDTDQKVGNWRIYVCKQCALAIAEMFGFVKREDYEQARREIASVVEALSLTEAMLQEAQDQQVRVVGVEEVVPYVKKQPGRPRSAEVS